MLTFPAIDFVAFHQDQLPARLAANVRLAAADVATAEPLALRLAGGPSFTYAPGPDGVTVAPGDDSAATIAAMGPAAFSDFAHELRTTYGLLYAGLVEFPRGDFTGLERWEPALRALFHGRPIYDDVVAAAARAGGPLDRTFTLADGDDALRGFLHRTGFLHVRGVLSAGEVDTLRAEVERIRADATPDDRRSWWAKDAAGAEVCCRLIYTNLASPPIGALADDARFRRVAALHGEQLEPELDLLDGISVVIKNPAVVEGLSDLPWHRDCGLGGHPVLCPTVAIGVQLDEASAENGQLVMLAGSWRTSSHQLRRRDEERWPVVALDTEPGDVTVHFGHTLHAAPPPSAPDAGRRAMYVTYARPESLEYVGPMHGYNDVLLAHGDGRVQAPAEVGAR
jgi:ectoine hydroxylase-related dioxygenase (phytanoyl-CoA dioxygenase family)